MGNLGSRLRTARERNRLSQVEVYKKTGINNKTLSRYENGGTEPDADSLRKLADLYEVTVDWLIKGEGSTYTLPEEKFIQIVRETEAKYNVTLHDDPVALETMRRILEQIAHNKHMYQKEE